MELVIVIAVIAVLAAVLIPTFANLTQRANESADLQTVKNLNTILSSEEVLGNKPATMSEAVAQADAGGYNVTALTPTSNGNDILWNQNTNRFVLANSETGELVYADEQVNNPSVSAEGYTYWKITDSDTNVEDGKYSYYLSDSFEDKDITVKAGIDVGENVDINITYNTEDEQSVIFNTNGGTLTIYAANSDVKHYGTAEESVITAVKKGTYHLYATVAGNVTLKKGGFAAEAGSSAAGLVVTAEAASDVVVTLAQNSAVAAVASTKLEGSALSGIITNNSDTEVVGKVEESNLTLFAGGLGTESSPYLIANEAQLMNVSQFADSTSVLSQKYDNRYFKQIADIKLTSQYRTADFSGFYDGDGYSITVPDTKNGIVVLFYGRADISISNLKLYSSETAVISTLDLYPVRNLTLDNINAYGPSSGMISINESNTGFLIYNHLYLSNSVKETIIIRNCNVYASVTNSGDCTGAFWGGSIYWKNDSDISFTVENCTFNGTINGSKQAGLIFGNGSGILESFDNAEEASEYFKKHLTITNVQNNGTIGCLNGGATVFGGNQNDAVMATLHTEYADIVRGTFATTSNILQGADFKVYIADNKLVFNGEGYQSGYTYMVAFTMSISTDSEYSNNGRNFQVELTYDVSAEGTALSAGGLYSATAKDEIGVSVDNKFGDFVIDGVPVELYILDNSAYVFVTATNGGYPRPANQTVTISIYAYDANGILVGTVNI